MTESEFIDLMAGRFGGGAEGIGDDAALVPHGLLVANDIVAEGVHFLKTTPLELAVLKLFASNVSDVAAMGGKAVYGVLGAALPEPEMLPPLYEAVVAAADRYDIKLIGGDTSESRGGIFLSLTILGTPGRKILARSGAGAGDLLYLSRPVGFSRISLEQELGLTNWVTDPYAHYRQEAETEVGSFLSSSGCVTSCMDISDGLGADAAKLAQASGVKAIICPEKLPLPAGMPEIADSVAYALSSGEEFALLFTVKGSARDAFEKEYENILKRKPFLIGRIDKGSGCVAVYPEGEKNLARSGYEHFGSKS